MTYVKTFIHHENASGKTSNVLLNTVKSELISEDFSLKTLKEILIESNEDIKNLNIQLGKKFNNPLNYNLTETASIGTVIKGNTLYYGILGIIFNNISIFASVDTLQYKHIEKISFL